MDISIHVIDLYCVFRLNRNFYKFNRAYTVSCENLNCCKPLFDVFVQNKLFQFQFKFLAPLTHTCILCFVLCEKSFISSSVNNVPC